MYSELWKVMVELGVPTTSSSTVIDKFPLATFDCARLVRSKSTHPFGGERVSVDRVISVAEHVGADVQVTVDSVNDEHGYAATVSDVDPTDVRYNRSSICVGVIAVGHGRSERSMSTKTDCSPLPLAPCPSESVVEEPAFVVGEEDEIVASWNVGTDGDVENTLFRLKTTVWLPFPSSDPCASA